ncbi:MAG: hypothetical protein HOP11_09600 [Saprospiraceae bacterium]|nr:hypothetical protein [Saprospiraceae bacterium]
MIHYYSFYIGDPGSRASTWKFVDMKIPAVDPRSAVMLHHFLEMYDMRIRCPWAPNKHRYFEPAPIIVDNKYRALIEWDKIERKSYGYTLVQFKRIRRISQYELMPMFKQLPLSAYK